MEKGIYAKGFFNLAENNIYKSTAIKDIDTNIGQLLKTDAKFYAIHVSPSEKELRVMGNTEQEQAKAMKRYIRQVFIPEYAKNFNKELSDSDIKFYGKIHFDRDRSDNELNMHCHLIVSRQDQTNKKKLSPLTNHKNSKKGTAVGGFDRVNLFQQAKQGFDKLFKYNRQQTESFNYHNMMQNGSIFEQFKLQEYELQPNERKIEINENSNQKNLFSINIENKKANNQAFYTDTHIAITPQSKATINPSFDQKSDEISGSFISIVSQGANFPLKSEEKIVKSRKKKKKGRKM